jgi:cytochrome P450
VPRFALADIQVGGYNIPKGSTVLANLYEVMRDPKVFDSPDEFHPERFIDLGEDPNLFFV